MSVFKKICFQCGKKVDSLIDSKCEECFNFEFPPILEVKPMNIRICNVCRKIHYKHGLFSVEKIEEMLPDIARKSLILDPHYTLNKLWIENFKIMGNRFLFNIKIDASLNTDPTN